MVCNITDSRVWSEALPQDCIQISETEKSVCFWVCVVFVNAFVQF